MEGEFIPFLSKIVEALIDYTRDSSDTPVKKWIKELSDQTKQHEINSERDPKLYIKIEEINTDSFETLVDENREAADALIKLAEATKPITMEDNHLALFGLTSTGKSTMINSLFGENVAETGYGETTRKMTPYSRENFVIWDLPGRNDETPYMTMQYISFMKALRRRLILINRTVKENSSLMKFMDSIGLNYAIVVSQFDLIKEQEKEKFCELILKEKEELKLKGVDHVFFVSALNRSHRQQDWLNMVKYLGITNAATHHS